MGSAYLLLSLMTSGSLLPFHQTLSQIFYLKLKDAEVKEKNCHLTKYCFLLNHRWIQQHLYTLQMVNYLDGASLSISDLVKEEFYYV